MNRKAAQGPSAAIRQSGLPVKVTGIVFWGLALVGLLFSVVQLQKLDDELTYRQQAKLDQFVLTMDRYMAFNPQSALPEIAEQANVLRRQLEIPMLELHYQGQLVRLGELRSKLVAHDRLLGASGVQDQLPVRCTLFLPEVEELIGVQRKRFLASMGGLFLLFGFILQWVLQRVLGRPFLQMVDTAQAFSAGHTEIRFDETRKDEFGYLGAFINKALDYVTLQQQELREALARVRDSEAALYEEKERAVVTLHSIGDAVITTTVDGRIEYFNPVAERLTGWTLKEVKGERLSQVIRLVDEVTQTPVLNPVEQCLQVGEVVELRDETLMIRRDGAEVPIADSAAPIRDRKGNIIGAIMVFHDVGHTRKLARQLSFQAAHDSLTGLYNRREFERRLSQALDEAQRDGAEHGLCYLYLDQFKIVNDICGHIAGDELLRQLSSVLQGRIRETDVLARLGGDEFGILLSHCHLDRAQQIAEEIRQAVRDFRFLYEDHGFEIGVSIGLVPVTRESPSIVEIMSAADVACYAAKDSGRNRIHAYQPDDEEMVQRRGELSWVSQIGRAIDEDRICLHYQPIVPLSGEGPVHYEMLVRLRDEKGAEVPPMAFIPAAERYNLMPMVDRWVVRRVLETFLEEERTGNGVFVMNLSGQTLTDDSFLNFVLEQLDGSHVEPGRICFEITETAAIANLRRATEFMKVLKARGCRFALDDFGSGLSSFGYLKSLEVDYLKIDGSFVKDMVEDDIDAAMVAAINEIGHVMGIRTIAEFVESESILLRLRNIGVDYAQGYWLARPKPLELLSASGTESSKLRPAS